MKIAYVYHLDAANPSVQSSFPSSALNGFKRYGAEVEPVFPLAAQPERALLRKLLYRLTGKHYRSDREPAFLHASAREFEARTAGRDYDFVFAPGSETVAQLRTTRPITFCADATFANMVDYYWDFTNLTADNLAKGHAQEVAALKRSALAIYSADWAAKSAINDYGADPAKVAVIPFGANHGKDNTWAQVEGWINKRPRNHIRLLFVGRHWERKGGDIVVNAAYCLSKLGHSVSLDVVGCAIPARHRALPWLLGHGLLSPRVPADSAKLHELFAGAHYVFVPSRAEAFGMIFAEANAFGVPAISTATGGIPGVVQHGHNGYLLPLDAGAEDYAELIASTFANPAHYARLCAQSFETFATTLNWDAFCRRFFELVAERGIYPAATGVSKARASRSLARVG